MPGAESCWVKAKTPHRKVVEVRVFFYLCTFYSTCTLYIPTKTKHRAMRSSSLSAPIDLPSPLLSSSSCGKRCALFSCPSLPCHISLRVSERGCQSAHQECRREVRADGHQRHRIFRAINAANLSLLPAFFARVIVSSVRVSVHYVCCLLLLILAWRALTNLSTVILLPLSTPSVSLRMHLFAL